MTTPEYEELLAQSSQVQGALALLRGYRAYLELLPSLRRPEASLIPIVLPLVRQEGRLVPLPCELALLPCDPVWRVKTDRDVLVFIHRQGEDYSQLLQRWRQTQICLSQPYEWVMPPRYSQLYNEGADKVYPLFVLWPNSPRRIQQGLQGEGLPCVVYPSPAPTACPGQPPSPIPNNDPV